MQAASRARGGRAPPRSRPSLCAVPGSGVASASASGESSTHRIGATPARTILRLAVRCGPRRRRRSGTTSAAAPSPSGSALLGAGRRARGSARPARAWSGCGRRRSEGGRGPATASSRFVVRSVASERDAAPRRRRTGAPTRSSSLPKIACSRCSPSRAWQRVAAVQAAREVEPPVPAARRLEQVAADRAHVAELRARGEAARLAQRVRDLRRRPRARPASLPAPMRVPSIPRGDDPRGRRRASRLEQAVAQKRHDLRRRRVTAAVAGIELVEARRLQELHASPSPLLPRRAQRAEHLLARDRQRADVGAGRVADRVRDRRGDRDDRRLAETLRAEVRQVLVRDVDELA